MAKKKAATKATKPAESFASGTDTDTAQSQVSQPIYPAGGSPADIAARQSREATAAAAPRKSHGTIKVRALADGYYDDKLRRPGDVFEIDATPLSQRLREQLAAGEGTGEPTKADKERLHEPAAFAEKWMERVSASTPAKQSSHNEVLRRQHDETLSERVANKRSTGDTPVLGD